MANLEEGITHSSSHSSSSANKKMCSPNNDPREPPTIMAHQSRRNDLSREWSVKRLDGENATTASQGSRRNLMVPTTSLRRIQDSLAVADDNCSRPAAGNRRGLLKRKGSETVPGHKPSGGGLMLSSPDRRLGSREMEEQKYIKQQESNDCGFRSIAPTISRMSSDRRLFSNNKPASRRNLLARAGSDKRLSKATADTSIKPAPRRNFLARAGSDKRLSKATGDNNSNNTPSSKRNLLARACSDKRLYLNKSNSERGINSSRKSKKVATAEDEEVDATDSIMAEMLSSRSAHSARIRSGESSSKVGMDDSNSSHSILVKTGSRRDLFAASSSMRNLFGTSSCHSNKQPHVSFAEDMEETFSYDAPTQEEKKVVYDSRPETEVFSNTKWLASCRLVAGSGVYKQAVDSVFGEKKGNHRSFIKGGDDVAETALFRAAVETIATSDLRGLEEVYSTAIKSQREQVIRKILEAYSNKSSLVGHRRFAKLASEESARSVKFARMLALADAREVEKYLSGIEH